MHKRIIIQGSSRLEELLKMFHLVSQSFMKNFKGKKRKKKKKVPYSNWFIFFSLDFLQELSLTAKFVTQGTMIFTCVLMLGWLWVSFLLELVDFDYKMILVCIFMMTYEKVHLFHFSSFPTLSIKDVYLYTLEV